MCLLQRIQSCFTTFSKFGLTWRDGALRATYAAPRPKGLTGKMGTPTHAPTSICFAAFVRETAKSFARHGLHLSVQPFSLLPPVNPRRSARTRRLTLVNEAQSTGRDMAVLSAIAVTFGRITTLLQVILYLPLTLDVAGQDAFLALSASLAVYYFFLSTIRTLTRRTSLAWIGDFLAVFQFIVVPACLLIVFHAYSPPSESYFNRKYAAQPTPAAAPAHERVRGRLFPSRSHPGADLRHMHSSADHVPDLTVAEAYLGRMMSHVLYRLTDVIIYLARHVPPWWHMLLRFSSPVFSLLEGVATLLVIQVIGSFSRWMIARSLLRRPPTPSRSPFSWVSALLDNLTSAEFLQLFFLLGSAFIYVVSALALYVSFEGATRNRPGTAAATGAAISSALWLTAIAFAVRKGNVVETSLVFAYVVWNVYQLSDSLSFTADPLALIRSFKVLDTSAGTVNFPSILHNLPPAFAGLVDLAHNALLQSARFGAAAAAALPKSVIVSLVFRLMVLYSASRILPLLKGQTAKAWDGDGSSWGSVSGSEDSSGHSDSEDSEEEKERAPRDCPTDEGRGKGKGKSSERAQGRRRTRRQKLEEDGLRLREEEPFGAFISLIVSYARLILIAVYSHLLLLDQSHMVYWRFLTVGITLFIWAFELVLGKDDNPDAAFAGSWR